MKIRKLKQREGSPVGSIGIGVESSAEEGSPVSSGEEKGEAIGSIGIEVEPSASRRETSPPKKNPSVRVVRLRNVLTRSKSSAALHRPRPHPFRSPPPLPFRPLAERHRKPPAGPIEDRVLHSSEIRTLLVASSSSASASALQRWISSRVVLYKPEAAAAPPPNKAPVNSKDRDASLAQLELERRASNL
uniref:Uncharacterized protein n=1 Tax=Ananas comosus var. bracteatus TaxID=296719 RepID=A0A6V7Q021_ANACO|nr:unnamed protein product [Ananas comosus var. bracteatus]